MNRLKALKRNRKMEIETVTGKNLIVPSNKDPFEVLADALAPQGIVGSRLKLTKAGEWRSGQENALIPLGTIMTVGIHEMLNGWVRWEGGRPAEENMTRVADGLPWANRA